MRDCAVRPKCQVFVRSLQDVVSQDKKLTVISIFIPVFHYCMRGFSLVREFRKNCNRAPKPGNNKRSQRSDRFTKEPQQEISLSSTTRPLNVNFVVSGVSAVALRFSVFKNAVNFDSVGILCNACRFTILFPGLEGGFCFEHE